MDQRTATPLLVGGAILLLLGVLARVGWLRWFGHLPGDIRIARGQTRIYAPLMSLLLVSLVLSVLSACWRRWF